MNKLFLLSLLFLFIIPVNAQKSSEREKVVNLIKQFDKAIANKDSVTLKKILTNEFIGTIPDGKSFNKKTFITLSCGKQHKERALKEESASGWSITISNGCAIVNRTITYLYKSTEVKVKRLDICLNISGKWFVASGQATEIL